MTIRTFTSIAVLATLVAATSGATAFGGKWLNQFGRYFGYGYGDGYHAAPQGAIGESILVGPGIAGQPTPAPALQPPTGPIEPSHRILPEPLKPMPLPSQQLSPAPSTTGEAGSHLRRPARQPGPVLSKIKERGRKGSEAAGENDGLTAPLIEGPGSIEIEGPTLAPAKPAADGSIDPFPEAPPVNPSGARPRFLLPPR